MTVSLCPSCSTSPWAVSYTDWLLNGCPLSCPNQCWETSDRTSPSIPGTSLMPARYFWEVHAASTQQTGLPSCQGTEGPVKGFTASSSPLNRILPSVPILPTSVPDLFGVYHVPNKNYVIYHHSNAKVTIVIRFLLLQKRKQRNRGVK